jgi:hypothetical protein
MTATLAVSELESRLATVNPAVPPPTMTKSVSRTTLLVYATAVVELTGKQ